MWRDTPPPPGSAGAILRMIPNRRTHFRHKVLCWVGRISTRAVCNVFSRELGREMVGLRVSMRHPRKRFLGVHVTLPFFSFFRNFGSHCVDLLGALGMKNFSIA